MAINLTIEFTRPSGDDQLNRDFELRIAQWLRRVITDHCAFQQPDIHVDFFDAPWREPLPSTSDPTPSDGSPLA